MKLQEIFDQLSYGELAMLSIGGQAQGVINESNYPRILAHVNLGLSALYKRFNLKEGRVRVKLKPDQYTYVLDSRYLEDNQRSPEPVKYLTNEPGSNFADDVLKIESVQVDSGLNLPINQAGASFNLATPSMATLRVPSEIVDKPVGLPREYSTESLLVSYRAGHPLLAVPIGYFDPARVEVQLPYSHLEALMYFVAGRISSPSGMTTEERLNNIWFAKFETACQQLELDNLEIDLGSVNRRLEWGGWV